MKYQIGTKLRYQNQTATITEGWWDGDTWRYSLLIRRGAKGGLWSVTEATLDALKVKKGEDS